jgi:ParB family chromosome partitioning protein
VLIARRETIARLAGDLDGLPAAPESLSENQIPHLACAMQNRFGEANETAINESSLTGPASQWQALLPILTESEHPDPEPLKDPRPGRPRRVTRPQPGVIVRREFTRDGWRLHFTGRDATGPLMDLLLDEIDRLLGPR